MQVKEQYQVKISTRFAALDSLGNKVSLNSVWERIKENIRTSGRQSRAV
jgi:hypothetical protein